MTFSADEVLRYRREKDHWMKTGPDSPLPAGERAKFSGLRYFPPDKSYYVPTKLLPLEPERPLILQTSDGQTRRYLATGTFEFRIGSEAVKLTAYRSNGRDDHLFLPFKDATAPAETYGAGRYLDVPRRPNQLIFLDLNYAYNPYCAYSDEYSCPFPPQENWLTIPVRAGEKNFRDPATHKTL